MHSPIKTRLIEQTWNNNHNLLQHLQWQQLLNKITGITTEAPLQRKGCWNQLYETNDVSEDIATLRKTGNKLYGKIVWKQDWLDFLNAKKNLVLKPDNLLKVL